MKEYPIEKLTELIESAQCAIKEKASGEMTVTYILTFEAHNSFTNKWEEQCCGVPTFIPNYTIYPKHELDEIIEDAKESAKELLFKYLKNMQETKLCVFVKKNENPNDDVEYKIFKASNEKHRKESIKEDNMYFYFPCNKVRKKIVQSII